MSRILAFTSKPEDWKKWLAAREKHWKPGYSAFELAHCWDGADGFPPEVAIVFRHCTAKVLANLISLLAIPEYQVPLPGGGHPSQNDIFVLAKSSAGPVSIMVEGKAEESFGPTIDRWLKPRTTGKAKRMSSLVYALGLHHRPPGSIRYQLLHRAASAIITGKQYHAKAAVMLVHSFSEKRAGWEDYQAFARLFGVEAKQNAVQPFGNTSGIPLFGAWVVGEKRL